MTVKLFTATKALIRREGKILILRESASYQDGINQGLYDVPGGRINPGEHFMDALKREVNEECGLTVTSATPFFVNEVRVNKHGEEWQIIRIFFACEAENGEVVLSDDHDAYRWIDPKEYKNINIIQNLNEVFAAYVENDYLLT